MARLLQPLKQLAPVHQRCCSLAAASHHLLFPASTSIIPAQTASLSFAASQPPPFRRWAHFRSRGLGLTSPHPPPSDLDDGGDGGESDSSDAKKSRNQKKREARRGVLWGMQLAAFTAPQIKRILKVASLEKEVYDALMLVKRLGPDVREGKRRQYNYIGKLLRDVEPELMDALILATKDGDWSRLRGLTDAETGIVEDDVEDSECEEEEEDSQECMSIATRWFDGLISKDNEITKEVYAVQSVDFDRRELRKLVRRVHAVQERQDVEENEQKVNTEMMAAKKSLNRFLRSLAKMVTMESHHIYTWPGILAKDE